MKRRGKRMKCKRGNVGRKERLRERASKGRIPEKKKNWKKSTRKRNEKWKTNANAIAKLYVHGTMSVEFFVYDERNEKKRTWQKLNSSWNADVTFALWCVASRKAPPCVCVSECLIHNEWWCKVCSHVWCVWAGDYQQAKGMRAVCMLRRLIHLMDKPFGIFDQIFAPKTRTHAFTLTQPTTSSIQFYYTIYSIPVGCPTLFLGNKPTIYIYIRTSQLLFLKNTSSTFIVLKIIDVPKIKVCIIYLHFCLANLANAPRKVTLYPKDDTHTHSVFVPMPLVWYDDAKTRCVQMCKWSRKPKAKRLAKTFMCQPM